MRAARFAPGEPGDVFYARVCAGAATPDALLAAAAAEAARRDAGAGGGGARARARRGYGARGARRARRGNT